MQIRAEFSTKSFNAYVNGEWVNCDSYKALVIAYRRAKKDRRTDPIQLRPTDERREMERRR